MKLQSYSTAILCFLVLLLCSCRESDPVNEEYKPITVESDWYEVAYLGDRVYRISEPKGSEGNTSYLILGDLRAIMFDTGSGENDPVEGTKIKHVIDQITSLPVTLILSHFHYDHTQNIHEFELVGFPELPDLKSRVSAEGIFTFSQEERFAGEYPSEVHVDEWFPLETDIELGKQVIRLVHIPGHADESVALIVASSKMILLGDFLYNGLLLLFNKEDLISYQQSVTYLDSILTPEYSLFGAHGTPEVDYGKLRKLEDFLSCIQEGACSYTEQTVYGLPAHIYGFQDMKLLIFQLPNP